MPACRPTRIEAGGKGQSLDFSTLRKKRWNKAGSGLLPTEAAEISGAWPFLQTRILGSRPMTEETYSQATDKGGDSKEKGIRYRSIDHIAIAVVNLDAAVQLFSEVLGFAVKRRLHINGAKTGMLSAEMEHGGLKFVLCQGTEPESQVTRLIDAYGPGVAHVALEVDDVATAVIELGARGMKFDTTVIEGPGLTQAFTSRDPNSGLSIELIKRSGEAGFVEANVQELFDQLEKSGSY